MKTLYSFEVPIKHLEDFNDLQDFHFTLLQQFSKPAYAGFYQRERKLGLRKIWLDNGYNECMKPAKWRDLLSLFRHVGADRLISPDCPEWSTIQIADEFLQLAAYLPVEDIICVVSSPKMIREMSAFGAKNFALSYWVRPKLTEDEIEYMRGCHFLGLNSFEEIKRYRPYSCDTSMPIKLAMQNKTVDQWVYAGYPHIHTKDLGLEGNSYFDAILTDSQIYMARENILILKEEV